MQKLRKCLPRPSADAIARRADKGEDVSRFFSNCGKMERPTAAEARAYRRGMADYRRGDHVTLGEYKDGKKEKAFFTLAERLRAAKDPAQVKQLGNQPGRFVFGE